MGPLRRHGDERPDSLPRLLCGEVLQQRAQLHDPRHLTGRKVRSDESSDIFVRCLLGDLRQMFAGASCGDTKVPEDLRISLQTDSFISAIRWWAKEKMKTRPEVFARYYLALMPGGPAAR